MKKLKTNKLALSTETLAPLTGAALDQVAGGAAQGGAQGGLTTLQTQDGRCGSCFCQPQTLVCTARPQ